MFTRMAMGFAFSAALGFAADWAPPRGGPPSWTAGVYVIGEVSQKYLQTYLDEYSFRYNRRDQGNLLFKSILEQVSEREE